VSPRVGAYVCPRGVAGIEYKFAGGGLQVLRSFDIAARIESERQAVDALVRALAQEGLKKAELTVALRGFGLAHHVLGLPPARDQLLTPIVEREIRRLEPGLDDPVVSWLPLPDEAADPADGPGQRHVLAAGAARHVVTAFEAGISAAGHRLVHLTALPAALQRLHEEFVGGAEPSAIVAPLRDGGFLGFFLGGGLRLVVEPPLGLYEQHDAHALAEETELGAVFMRQQFRGAQVGRVVIAAPASALPDADSAFRDRLQVAVSRLAAQDVSAGALAALGAVLDGRATRPLSLLPATGKGASYAGTLRAASIASLVLAAGVGAFAGMEAVRANRAAAELQRANTRIEQESFGLMSLRETAGQRKLIADAVAMLRAEEKDRGDLQRALGSIAAAILPPVRLDSLQLSRGDNGWVSIVTGRVDGLTSARAVELLHEFYRELPKRVVVEDLTLAQLVYADAAPDASDTGGVRFQVSFVVPYPKSD
jgi:hypothetical protein